jgi:small-conductance mechanosensitive channel
MTDTDIAALAVRLRRSAGAPDHLRARDAEREAADALEALQADNADLRGLLAETVPDPEYRKMQDDEIERLREERKAMLTRAEKAEAKLKRMANAVAPNEFAEIRAMRHQVEETSHD